ncbi:MAG: PAAR domain-containing protein [Thermoanaerobaculia bacterium]
MNPAARLGDNHTCPLINPDESPHTGGPISEGEGNVLVGYMPAARLGDQATCIGSTDTISTGTGSILISYMPAAALGDQTSHGGFISQGENTVLIGDSTAGAGGATGATMRAARNEARPFCELCCEGQGDG